LILTDSTSTAELRVFLNELEGEVPEGLFQLSKLIDLDLGDNVRLGGTIPETIAVMQSLKSLYLPNMNMTGTQPVGLFDLINLQSLHLHSSSFSGTLSTHFARLSNLDEVELHDNNFSGTIPDGFGQLSYLGRLVLHSNALTGTVSKDICNRRGKGYFDLNFLTTDCIDEVSCTCCDECY